MTILTGLSTGTPRTVAGVRAFLGKGLGESPPPPFVEFELDPRDTAARRGRGGGMILMASQSGARVTPDYTLFVALQNASIECSGFGASNGMRVRTYEGELKIILPGELEAHLSKPDNAPYDLPRMIGHTLEAQSWIGTIEHACENQKCLLAHIHRARRNA